MPPKMVSGRIFSHKGDKVYSENKYPSIEEIEKTTHLLKTVSG